MHINSSCTCHFRALAAGVGNYLVAAWPCGVFVGAVLATLDWGCDR